MDIKSELNLIRKSIEELHTELSLTKGEIRKLRLAIQNKKREKPKEATLVSPMWCYEWDQMTIDLDPMTWKSIRSGELVIARGRGTRLDNPLPNGDDCFQWDFWTFNGDEKGSVIIEMGEPDVVPESPDVAFSGDLEDLEVIETEVETTRKKKRI
jgi:hypothetical protein